MIIKKGIYKMLTYHKYQEVKPEKEGYYLVREEGFVDRYRILLYLEEEGYGYLLDSFVTRWTDFPLVSSGEYLEFPLKEKLEPCLILAAYVFKDPKKLKRKSSYGVEVWDGTQIISVSKKYHKNIKYILPIELVEGDKVEDFYFYCEELRPPEDSLDNVIKDIKRMNKNEK
jgi:hypothetical protein